MLWRAKGRLASGFIAGQPGRWAEEVCGGRTEDRRSASASALARGALHGGGAGGERGFSAGRQGRGAEDVQGAERRHGVALARSAGAGSSATAAWGRCGLPDRTGQIQAVEFARLRTLTAKSARRGLGKAGCPQRIGWIDRRRSGEAGACALGGRR